MIRKTKNSITFHLERYILRGAHYRLLVIAALVGFVAFAGGILAFWLTSDFDSLQEGVWWAFLRLTDPGYLGDDKGYALRIISTAVTVLGYVLFMGSLIAIMTQWLDQTIRHLESGTTPIAQKKHVLILGWSNRTPAIVRELLLTEGRVRRFLERHGAKRLRIVILSEEVSAERRTALREYLGVHWSENQIIFRSGSPLNPAHLYRVDFINAAAIILPGSEIEWGGLDAADMRTIKTMLSLSNLGSQEPGSPLPFLVSEIFDARKIEVARGIYKGSAEILASDSVISLLVAQNVRHKWLSYVYTELLTHGEESNEIYIRRLPNLAGTRFQDLFPAYSKAVPIGIVRTQEGSSRTILNPPDGFFLENDDRLVFLSRFYADTEFPADDNLQQITKGKPLDIAKKSEKKRILIMGWNDKIPALINEFDNYENEDFEIDILSAIPTDQREQRMARYALRPRRVVLQQLEGDYVAPSDLEIVKPETYDNVVIVGCDWLPSMEEADARTILGHLLLKQILADKGRRPEVLLELMDPRNHELFNDSSEEVLISPLILSHILAHVALRPDLNVVFHNLFSSGGAEIFFRPASFFNVSGKLISFNDIQRAAATAGEIALGLRVDSEADTPGRGIYLNPPRRQRWQLKPEDEIAVLALA